MRGRGLLIGAGCALVFALALPGAADAELTCARVPQLASEFLHSHVAYKKLTPELETRAIAMYVQRLDASRSVFLSNEITTAEASLTGIMERMRKGDCEPLMALHKQLVAENAQLEEFVRQFVMAPGYALDENVTLVLDPAERGNPKTAAERDTLQKSLIHFQMSNYLSAGEPLEEAKKRLVHRYELRTKRLKELQQDDILAGFLDSFALALDPHSNYLSADVLEDFRISMSLSLEGIGVALSERDGYSVVERIIPGGAADRIEKERLEPEDKIIAVAEEGGQPVDIIDMPLRDAVSLIRGKKGTRVQLTVLREGEETRRFPVVIERDTIDLAEQAAKLRFETRERNGKKYKLAIIDLSSFYGDSDPTRRQCTDDLEKLLEQVKAENADGLLLDLSRNGGGLLEHAVQISGFFLRRGEVVGVQNSREQLQVLADQDERILYSGPMVVHTSRASASASEILAGALKDYHRAVITGDDHTFGKGTVQTVTPLPPGEGALKITTALFFRPGGRSTQNEGVSVDVPIPSMLITEDFGESTQEYALPSKEIPAFMGTYANAIGPTDRFAQVDSAEITELAKRSKQRVDESAEFKELGEKIAKARKEEKSLKLADLMRERDEAKANGDAKDAKDGKDAKDAKNGKANAKAVRTGDDGKPLPDPAADDEPTPQLEEAVAVLADLVELARNGS
ncbi:MAG TPA: carboxy terminal-processing peptidase [Myxococcota bacterium]|nr:carboxy terminal-processing peptidase [Myxococcota bacterium]